jgi:ribosomal protein S18 acetylase RimI-like enzyme
VSQYIFSRLEWDDTFDFDCKDPEINDYFYRGRPASQEELQSVSYCLTAPSGDKVAFVSLSNGLFQGIMDDVGSPAVTINALGVNHNHQSKGIGRSMIQFLQAYFVIKNKTGCRYMTLRATNKPDTIKFYEKYCHFIKINGPGMETIPMYFDLIDTRDALASDPVLDKSYRSAIDRMMMTGSTIIEVEDSTPPLGSKATSAA